MDFNANTVLVTGGGSGIGFAISERFLQAGSTVIIMGSIEATYGFSTEMSRATPEQLEAIFKRMNQPHLVG
ncbi:MAG: SDR family NAD(P)-dependent oxidoreductase [Proteobacteria bacterium]|nr:SDR family NAD(P)-dependent oxidoreductase [Pseudomonadota bacterium]